MEQSAQTAPQTAPVQPTQPQQPAPTTDAKQDQAAQRLAHMARQERALRQQQAKIAQERQQITAMQQAMDDAKKQYETQQAWRSRLSNGDYSALEEAGITKEQLTSYLINQPDPNMQTLAQMKAAIKSLEDKNSELVNAMTTTQKIQHDEAIKQMTSDGKFMVKSEPQRYEMVSASDGQGIEAAVELVEYTYNKDGYLLPLDQALDYIEDFYESEGMRIANLPKIRSKIAPPAPPPRAPRAASKGEIPFSTAVREQNTQAPVRPTLTHQNMPSSTVPTKTTAKDRVARAIAAFNGAR